MTETVPLVRKFLHVGVLSSGDEIANIPVCFANDLPAVGQEVMIHSADSLTFVGTGKVITVNADKRSFDVTVL